MNHLEAARLIDQFETMRGYGEMSSQGSITLVGLDDMANTVLGDGPGRVCMYSSYITHADMYGSRGMPSRAKRNARADKERNDEAAADFKCVSSELAMTQGTLKTTQSVLNKMQLQMNFLLKKTSFTSEDHDMTLHTAAVAETR